MWRTRAKKINSRLNNIDLFKDFITHISNLDGRLFKSIRHLWKPVYLAKEYIARRRKTYVNPIRFILVMLVLLFFLLNRKINSIEFDKGTIDGISIVHQKKFAANYDSTLCLLIRNLKCRPRTWIAAWNIWWRERKFY